MTQGLAAALRGAALAVACAFVVLLSAAVAVAEPGLWVARSPQATIYLFGTIHVLKKDQIWKSPAIAQALAQSAEIWLELPDLDNTGESQAVVARLGTDPAHPLSTKLSRAELAHLDATAASLGLRGGERALEPMRPWLAAIALEEAVLVAAGYDPASGVERALLQEAKAARKPVHGFETLEQQMRYLAGMSPMLELQFLDSTLREADQGPTTLAALIAAWLAGDDAAISRIMVDEIRLPFPELYRTLLVERNERWAQSVAGMLKAPGIRFIAVGAAHLAGPDSVQAALERRGIRVTRLTSPR